MTPRLLESHPLVEETLDQLAVKRGPIVYCLESVDMPEGTSLADMRIPADVELEPQFDADLLGGVTVLKGTLSSRNAIEWNGELYREFRPRRGKPVYCTLIPYYVWANRGPSEMSVWLPIDDSFDSTMPHKGR